MVCASWDMAPSQTQLQEALQRCLGPAKTVDEQAKLAVAQALLKQAFEGQRDCLGVPELGPSIRAAVGGAFGTGKERIARGQPTLTQILQGDSLFKINRTAGGPSGTSLTVQLNMPALESMLTDVGPRSDSSDQQRGHHATTGSGAARPQRQQQQLPIRPNASNCAFYMSRGWCGRGAKCPHNHPELPERHTGAANGVVAAATTRQQPPSGERQYNQPPLRETPGSRSAADALNSAGLPLRPGVRDCPHFSRHGHCKHGARCWFNHPEPAGTLLVAVDAGEGHLPTSIHLS
jgi:hypothetical protein